MYDARFAMSLERERKNRQLIEDIGILSEIYALEARKSYDEQSRPRVLFETLERGIPGIWSKLLGPGLTPSDPDFGWSVRIYNSFVDDYKQLAIFLGYPAKNFYIV